jgi:membrane associated rhomboid family serine protease
LATKTPWATLALLALNVLAGLATSLDPQVALELGFDPRAPGALTGVTSLFLHANLFHLLGNLVFLAAAGPAVEFSTGPARFLGVYVAGGVGGLLAHMAVSAATGMAVPIVGASAALAAVVGYASVRFMSVRVPVLPRVAIPVGALALLWVVLQATGALTKAGGPGGTAYWSHLAGFLIGVAASLVLRAPQQARVQFGHQVLDEMNARGPAALLVAAERHLADHPDDPRALDDLARAARDLGEPEVETEALLRTAEAVPAARDVALGRLIDLGRAGQIPAAKRLRWAESLGESVVGVRLLESVADSTDPLAPDAMLVLAERAPEPERRSWAARLVAEHSLHAAAEIARQKGLAP